MDEDDGMGEAFGRRRVLRPVDPRRPLLAGITGAETGKVCLTYKNLGKSTQPGRGPQAMI